MAEVFSGNISLFKLIDILRLLTTEGKTGVLSLQRGAEKGEIYLDKGILVHAICKNGVGEEAVFTLLTWMEGSFNFTPNVISDERSIERDTSLLLEEGIKRLDEWDQIKEIIPSQDLVFKLSALRAPDEITLGHSEWSVLSQIDGNKTVGEIAEGLEMGEYDTARTIYKLFLSGLIEVAVEPKLKSKKTVDPGFFDFVEERLTKIIGPVAPVILEEEIRGVGEERSNFPLDKASILVEKVSGEISDDAQRIEFQKVVLGALRGI
ncbi:MAG: DUF4388 domain-containing protein [Deltaproteobacteria bacterium]|nr:DUF4388 domain-containing protein [Deltaproteobacteria bacterium]